MDSEDQGGEGAASEVQGEALVLGELSLKRCPAGWTYKIRVNKEHDFPPKQVPRWKISLKLPVGDSLLLEARNRERERERERTLLVWYEHIAHHYTMDLTRVRPCGARVLDSFHEDPLRGIDPEIHQQPGRRSTSCAPPSRCSLTQPPTTMVGTCHHLVIRGRNSTYDVSRSNMNHCGLPVSG